MSLQRQAPRRDANEPSVVQALLATVVPKCGAEKCRCGVSVQSLSGSPGLVDLLIGVTWATEDGLERSETELIEVKNPDGKGTKLTPDQQVWHRTWKGKEAFIVEGPEDIPKVMGCIMGLGNVIPIRRGK
jgi:hypothetical protein